MHLFFKLIAMIYLAATLIGCHRGDRTVTVRIIENGVDRLYSQVDASNGNARFQCLASRSGQCHYALFPTGCHAGGCSDPPLRHFALRAGEQRHEDALPESFVPCVSDSAAPIPRCDRGGV